MSEERGGLAQLRLMAWLSPAFPIGAFSYSHGLERAVHDGLVTDADDLRDWIVDLVARGSSWNDAVLLAESWRCVCAGGDVAQVSELAEALAGSAERHRETMLQGAAFLQAAAAWPSRRAALAASSPYPVAVGAVAAAHGVPLEATLAAYLQAFASNMIQAAIRLGVTGQSGATAMLAKLETSLVETAARAARSSPDDLGSSTIVAEIASMRHETQYSRLFRS